MKVHQEIPSMADASDDSSSSDNSESLFLTDDLVLFDFAPLSTVLALAPTVARTDLLIGVSNSIKE